MIMKYAFGYERLLTTGSNLTWFFVSYADIIWRGRNGMLVIETKATPSTYTNLLCQHFYKVGLNPMCLGWRTTNDCAHL